MDLELNRTATDIDTVKEAKTSIRKAIDCHPVGGDTKRVLFEHYEGLCKRMVFMKNAYEDLKIKKKILAQEILRCNQRSKSLLFTLVIIWF